MERITYNSILIDGCNTLHDGLLLPHTLSSSGTDSPAGGRYAAPAWGGSVDGLENENEFFTNL
jgi:hypothetical protein